MLLEFHHTAPSPLPVRRPRPVDPDWACQRSGDCCRAARVVMTEPERELLQGWADQHWTLAQLQTLHFDQAEPGFVSLRAGPCPFLSATNICTVHAIRPYNCRRFACLRPDPSTEPLEGVPPSPILTYRAIGCANLRDRLVHSRVARRLYTRIQKKAQRWALAHGWREA